MEITLQEYVDGLDPLKRELLYLMIGDTLANGRVCTLANLQESHGFKYAKIYQSLTVDERTIFQCIMNHALKCRSGES